MVVTNTMARQTANLSTNPPRYNRRTTKQKVNVFEGLLCRKVQPRYNANRLNVAHFKNHRFVREFGGRGGARTPGLIVANDALSQLSYTPTNLAT